MRGNRYSQKVDMKNIAAVHEEIKQFKCDICDYRCSQKGDMSMMHQFMKKISLLSVTCDYSYSQQGQCIAAVHEGKMHPLH